MVIMILSVFPMGALAEEAEKLPTATFDEKATLKFMKKL